MSKKENHDSAPEGAEVQQDNSTDILDAEIVEQDKPADNKPVAAANRGGMATTLSLVAILLAVAGAGLAAYTWKGLEKQMQGMQQLVSSTQGKQAELADQLTQTRTAFDALSKELEQQKSLLSQQDEKLAQEREQVKQQGEELKATLDKVYQRVGRDSTAWMAAEAEYLMRIANHRLRLERDVKTAVEALQAADARLRDTGDPGWIEVRKQIADEIAVLQGVGQLDRAGISATLSSLIKQIKGLKMVGLQYTPERPSEPELTKPEERSLETLLKDGWNGFKSVMVIRHRDKPVTAMLAPEQQFFVYQNLELQLEAARLAMLRGDQVLYDNSLKLTNQWLGEFFDTQANATTALIGEIGKLQKVDVNPQLPDVSQSLLALRERLKQKEQGEAGQ